jgi:membrane protein
LVFKYVHDGIVKWRLAFRGALLTGTLLYLGQLLIKYYLFNYFFAANGGIAGTFFIILAWVYYSSQIIFYGAKFTAVYAKLIGQPIQFKK